jgi:hypothetical protein
MFNQIWSTYLQKQLKVQENDTRVCPKVSGLRDNEINNDKHSLRSNTKDYGGKTH